MDGVQIVKLLVTNELIEALADWSNPVQVRIERDESSETGWTMHVRTVNLEDIRTS